VAGAAVRDGVAAVTGTTASGDFPTSSDAWSRVLAGPADAFVVLVRAANGAPVAATLYGGPGHDGAAAAASTDGGFAIAGLTVAGVPVSATARPFAGTTDAFVGVLGTDGRLVAATHFGGRGFDEATAITYAGGVLHAGGSTLSDDLPVSVPVVPRGREPGWVATIPIPDDAPARLPPAVVLVHGWQGMGGKGSACSEGATRHPTGALITGHAGSIGTGELLEDAGFEVWHAHLDSSGAGTPPLAANAACLAEQVASVRAAARPREIMLVGHSMGGLVARAYIEDDALYAPDVTTLVTLGAPHGGVPADLPLLLFSFLNLDALGSCDAHPALCELSLGGAAAFERRYPTRREGVRYLAVAGSLGGSDAGWLGKILGALIAGRDDAVVPTGSGRALAGAPSLETGEGHTPGTPELPVATRSYFGPFPGPDTSLPGCVVPFLTGIGCPGAEAWTEARPDASAGSVAHSPVHQIDLGPGEVTTRTVAGVGTELVVGAHWDEPGVAASFDPVPATIDRGMLGVAASFVRPAGAITVTFSGAPDRAARVALSSIWPGASGVAGLEVPAHVPAGAALPLTFTMAAAEAGPVVARLRRPDGSTVTTTLSAAAPNTWTGTVPAGSVPGTALVGVTAGSGPAALNRAADVRIGSDRISLTGAFAARPEDRDGDGRYEALAVDVGVASRAGGPCALALSVYVPGGTEPLARAGGRSCDAASPFTATLRVGGELLRRAPPGPWQIRDIVLEDMTAQGSVEADADPSGFLTPAFDPGRFGEPWAVYAPAALRPVARGSR
jgi:pimeloyl-ACP methyl ester carboxylesterase